MDEQQPELSYAELRAHIQSKIDRVKADFEARLEAELTPLRNLLLALGSLENLENRTLNSGSFKLTEGVANFTHSNGEKMIDTVQKVIHIPTEGLTLHARLRMLLEAQDRPMLMKEIRPVLMKKGADPSGFASHITQVYAKAKVRMLALTMAKKIRLFFYCLDEWYEGDSLKPEYEAKLRDKVRELEIKYR